MQTVAAKAAMLGLFSLGTAEIVLILALVLILLGARWLPGRGRGWSRGISEFRKATGEVTHEMDKAASEAGRSVGGIYGKPAAEALMPDNQIAELYDPAVLQDNTNPRRRWLVTSLLRLCRWLRHFVHAVCGLKR